MYDEKFAFSHDIIITFKSMPSKFDNKYNNIDIALEWVVSIIKLLLVYIISYAIIIEDAGAIRGLCHIFKGKYELVPFFDTIWHSAYFDMPKFILCFYNPSYVQLYMHGSIALKSNALPHIVTPYSASIFNCKCEKNISRKLYHKIQHSKLRCKILYKQINYLSI